MPLKLGFFGALFIFFMSCVTPQLSNEEIFSQGNEFAKDGLLREAAESFKAILKRDPKNSLARRNLGIVFLKSGDYEQAIQSLESVIDIFQNDFDTNYYLGEGYRAKNEYGKAIFRYQVALSVKADDHRVGRALAWSYYKIRFFAEALDVAKRVLDQDPKDSQASIIMARTLIRLKRFKEASDSITSAKLYASDIVKPYLQTVEGDIYLEQKKFEEAGQIYRGVVKTNPMMASALLGMGLVYQQNGDNEKARELLERSARIKPEHPETHWALAGILETKDPAKALLHYKKFAKLTRKDPEFIAYRDDLRKKVIALKSRIKDEQNNGGGTNVNQNGNTNPTRISPSPEHLGQQFR